MSDVNLQFVERYQKILKKDAQSRVFAPLVEAYRKLGMLNEAVDTAEKGVEKNPRFASGRVALGRVYTDLGKIDEALTQFKEACQLAPDNLMAHMSLGKTYLRLRRPKEALAAYKMVLFFNPNDSEAQKVIKKLESLTADEYEDEVFSRIDLKQIQWEIPDTLPKNSAEDVLEEKTQDIDDQLSPEMERAKIRALSLADALIIRNDITKARELLNQTRRSFGNCTEIDHRMTMIKNRFEEEGEEEPSPIKPISYRQLATEEKVQKLEKLLSTVAAHKNSRSPS